MFINVLGMWNPPYFKVLVSDDIERLFSQAAETTYSRFTNKGYRLFAKFNEAPYGGFYRLKHPDSLFSADALILCVYVDGEDCRLPVGSHISIVWASNGEGLALGFHPKTSLKYVRAGVLGYASGRRIVEYQVDESQIGFWLYPLIDDSAPFGIIVNLDSAEFI